MNDTDHLTKTRVSEPDAETLHCVGWDSLPVSCPLPEMSAWNSHPRVYLPLLESNDVSCAYCGTRYVLRDPVPGENRPSFPDADIEKAYDRRMARARQACQGIPCEPSLAA